MVNITNKRTMQQERPGLNSTATTRSPVTLPLDPRIVVDCTTDELLARLRGIFRNVHVVVEPAASGFRIVGPRMAYLAVDPDLFDVVKNFGVEPTVDGILRFHISTPELDLSFEDSWSGFHIARHLIGRDEPQLIVLHLDDHHDMMPAYIANTPAGLIDLPLGRPFDPRQPADWEQGIASGAIGIGNFLTPFFYTFDRVHVLHLADHYPAEPSRWNIVHSRVETELCPAFSPIALRRRDWDWEHTRGTLVLSSQPSALLSNIPEGVFVGHVDLDYFANTYNGHTRAPLSSVESTRELVNAHRKMERFFEAMSALHKPIERWCIATSPGFCPSRAWRELLAHFEDGLRTLNAPSRLATIRGH